MMTDKIAMAIAQAVILAAILGAYGFAWSINNRVTVIENSNDLEVERRIWMLECKARIIPECNSSTPEPE